MRPIDADALDVLTIIGERMDGKVEFAKAVNEMIQNAPTIDAVEVVRCEDCKNWWESAQMCTIAELPTGSSCCAEDYCSKAERKEE